MNLTQHLPNHTHETPTAQTNADWYDKIVCGQINILYLATHIVIIPPEKHTHKHS